MLNTKNGKLVLVLLLLVSMICLTCVAVAASEQTVANTVLPDIGSVPSARMIWTNPTRVAYMPDALENVQVNSTLSGANVSREFTGYAHKMQNALLVLLMLLICTSAFLLLQKRRRATGTKGVDMPIMAWSLGGNSPPIIRA